MNVELDEYIKSLQIPAVTSGQIRKMLAFYRDNKLITPEFIFINQEKDADQNIRANRLWLFGQGMCAEADLNSDKLSGDVATLKFRVRRYHINASDTDFLDGDSSRYLNIDAALVGGLGCDFQAFGVNRNILWDVFLKCIHPNLISAP
jgi:hypothetical protein